MGAEPPAAVVSAGQSVLPHLRANGTFLRGMTEGCGVSLCVGEAEPVAELKSFYAV